MKKTLKKLGLISIIYIFGMNLGGNVREAQAISSEFDTKKTSLWDIEEQNHVKYDKDQQEKPKNQEYQMDTRKIYENGVKENKIDEKKYPFELFKKHEKEYFISLYRQFITFDENSSISYESWIANNGYGVEPGLKEPFFEEKPDRVKRGWKENKAKFTKTVKKGDILLVTGDNDLGLIGHAAIMTTDNWVLEMRGIKSDLKDNSHQLSKDKWFDKNKSNWTTVYRMNSSTAKNKAANWCDRKFYSSTGGETKNRKIAYSLWPWHNFDKVNPNYCSKMVLQGFYFGTGNLQVVNRRPVNGELIAPLGMYQFFSGQYKLYNKGKF